MNKGERIIENGIIILETELEAIESLMKMKGLDDATLFAKEFIECAFSGKMPENISWEHAALLAGFMPYVRASSRRYKEKIEYSNEVREKRLEAKSASKGRKGKDSRNEGQ